MSKLKFDWDSRRGVSEPRAGEGRLQELGWPSPGAWADRRSLYAASKGEAEAANYLCCIRLDIPTYITTGKCYVRGSLRDPI